MKDKKSGAKEQIIKALTGENIEEVQTVTSTEYPVKGGAKESQSAKIDKLLKGCKHDGSYIPVGEVKRLMQEYAEQYHKSKRREELIKYEIAQHTTDGKLYGDKKRIAECIDKYLKQL